MKKLILLICAGVFMAGLSGCASISEKDCLAGGWNEYGYRDGLNGLTSDRVAKYAETCAEFGVKPDSEAYLTGHDRGLVKYCTYERGYARGENGDSYNQVCSGPLAADFAPGYDAGRAAYEIYRARDGLIASYEETLDALYEVRRKLTEDELTDGDRRRLLKKEIRLEDLADEQRMDVRAFERQHDLPRHQF